MTTLLHRPAPFFLARLLTSFELRPASGLSNSRHLASFPLWRWSRWMNARSFATGDVTESLPQLDDVLRVFNACDPLSYEQIDSALQGVVTQWHSKRLVKTVLQHIKDPETAFNFFVWAADRKGFRPTSVEYNDLIEILGSAEKFPLMNIVVKRMDDTRCRMLPSTFTILIKYYGKAGMVDEATNTLALMKKYGAKPRVRTYNNLINIFVKEDRLDVAFGVLEHMLSVDLSPNEYTVNFLTDGLCKAGKLDEAQKFVSGAPVSNIVVYNVLLKGFCKAGKAEKGHKILGEMVARGCFPDEYTYNTLIVGSCKAGKLDFALKLLEEMLERNIAPTLITYRTLIIFLCKRKREKQAFELLANMKSEGMVLTWKDQASLLDTFSTTKMKLPAAELLRKITEDS